MVPLFLPVYMVSLGLLSFFQVNAQPFAFSPSHAHGDRGSTAVLWSLFVSAPGGLSSQVPGLAWPWLLFLWPLLPGLSCLLPATLSVSPYHPTGSQGSSGSPAHRTHTSVGGRELNAGFSFLFRLGHNVEPNRRLLLELLFWIQAAHQNHLMTLQRKLPMPEYLTQTTKMSGGGARHWDGPKAAQVILMCTYAQGSMSPPVLRFLPLPHP